jgi:hypothetical protein
VLVAPLVAEPADNVTGDPKFEPSILNWMEPVGVPVPAGALTVALNVIDCPNVDGFTEDDSTVVVFAGLTVWLKFADVLVLKVPSPPYTAVMVCEPPAKAEVAREADPPDSV